MTSFSHEDYKLPKPIAGESNFVCIKIGTFASTLQA